MGDAGEEFGLSLLRGPEAYASLQVLLSLVPQGDDLLDEMDLLGLSMEAFGNLGREGKTWIRKAGLSPGNREPMPCFLVKSSGYRAILPEDADRRCLLAVLRAVLAADDQRLLEPAELTDPRGLCFLNLNDDPLDALVSVTHKPWNASAPEWAVPFPQRRPDLSDLDQHDGTLLVGWHDLPAQIRGDPRTTRVLLVVDEASELVLQQHAAFADQLTEVADALFDVLQTPGPHHPRGLPSKMIFSGRKLFETTAPVLENAGVQCTYQPSIPILQELIEDLRQFMERGPGTY